MLPNDHEITSKSKFSNQNVQFWHWRLFNNWRLLSTINDYWNPNVQFWYLHHPALIGHLPNDTNIIRHLSNNIGHCPILLSICPTLFGISPILLGICLIILGIALYYWVLPNIIRHLLNNIGQMILNNIEYRFRARSWRLAYMRKGLRDGRNLASGWADESGTMNFLTGQWQATNNTSTQMGGREFKHQDCGIHSTQTGGGGGFQPQDCDLYQFFKKTATSRSQRRASVHWCSNGIYLISQYKTTTSIPTKSSPATYFKQLNISSFCEINW